MLAPWTLSLQGQDLRWHHGIDDDPEMPGFERFADREALDVTFALGRTMRGTTTIQMLGLYTRDEFDDLDPRRARLGGLGLSFSHNNADASRKSGVRWQLSLALDAAYYPRRFSTIDTDLADTREELVLAAPIPWTRRHRLTLDVRQRALLQQDPVRGFRPLVVGGAGLFAPLYERRTPDLEPPGLPSSLLPERLRFLEPFRGFEDLELPATGAAIAELSWRYPLIADTGWATSLYYFPAVLVRELALELFGSAARVVTPVTYTDHYAAGGAMTLAIYLWRAPLLLRYQLARRFTDDEAWSQQVGIALGL
jgi:hypothetical protein